MKIAYRRMSGPIGLSNLETGTRGMWLEKRRAFLSFLRSRGHKVRVVNRMTKFSEGSLLQGPLESDTDLLFIEFGSSNRNFYGDDLNETIEMARNFEGQIVYLCDDPDLEFIWGAVREHSRWAVWVNATKMLPLLKQPESIPTFDFPFSSVVSGHATAPRQVFGYPLVYMGRPNGRVDAFKQIEKADIPLAVYGRPTEWSRFNFPLRDPPPQAQRGDMYAEQVACLAIADKKHKRMGWRTGRAYHAICAGCPSIVEPDNEELARELLAFKDMAHLAALHGDLQEPGYRNGVWKLQMLAVLEGFKIAEKTASRFGL